MASPARLLLALGLSACDCGASSHGPGDAAMLDAPPVIRPDAPPADTGPDAPWCSPGSTGECGPSGYCAGPDFGRCGGKDIFGGTCELRPDDCTGEPIDPVCGCDGVTYDDICLAHAAGVDAVDGRCPPGPPCSSVMPCAGGTTCVGEEGCTAGWYCVATGSTCTFDAAAWCGCDGVTWYDSSTCPTRPYEHIGECTVSPMLTSCDPRSVVCDRPQPACPPDHAPVVVDGCYNGGCVPLSTCACTTDASCPGPGWSCNAATGRCWREA